MRWYSMCSKCVPSCLAHCSKLFFRFLDMLMNTGCCKDTKIDCIFSRNSGIFPGGSSDRKTDSFSCHI